MPEITRRSLLFAGSATAAAALLLDPARALAAPAHNAHGTLTVRAGQNLVLSTTTRLRGLVIAAGGAISAPDGYSITLTVDGVETGQRLVATGATVTAIVPGRYHGDIVLTVAEQNVVPFVIAGPPGSGASSSVPFPFRQALYVGSTGVSAAKSVSAAVQAGSVTTAVARGIVLRSTGEAFNGVFVDSADYTLDRPDIAFDGNGRCDFIGYGAAVVAQGSAARLVVRGARIDTKGAVRTGVVANNTANVIVKDSTIGVRNGVLPADYQATVDTEYMESAPWMLGISGNVRATNLLGDSTRATYLNSDIRSEGWGALSTDSGQNCTLTVINCRVGNTGQDGYGTYAIGNATENLLGCTFDVGTYATINRGGAVHYGDSTRAAVAAANSSLDLRLTARELAAIPVRACSITSRRFGFMWHGAGTLAIDGGTVVDSTEATFLDKGQQIGITVDGSGGARLNPRNGILLQVMENDDPGPVMVDGSLVNAGVYTEPTTPPEKDSGWDTTAVHADTDAVAAFTDITLRGDFFNGMRGGLNLALTFTRTRLTGTISATTTRHHISTISADQYRALGEVTNTAGPAVNNGVIVDLAEGTCWTVTGTSHLTSLTLAADASVTGRSLAMTVDGVRTQPKPGHSYTGAIVLTVG